jgi:hypothetical protein
LDGKAVQYRGSITGEWYNTKTAAEAGYMSMPQFRASCEYRIKPETIKYRVAMMNGYPSIVYPKSYSIIELDFRFVRWVGPEQEVVV